ncbi:hypothetical protein PHLCEN_2v347 [Hermanssonia centrifuga]|uniref:Uncharacterized protein n=1 Tax=Hermanssonia centrifuga TaxID=98765 RepID=A0A2R6S6Q3_9APHY|nr:hypothetical protein PHLCEN_2v347 [Hermanssonia centrifuga]
MSLLRTALLRPQRAPFSTVPRRLASSEAHDEHHDDHHHVEDTTVYPKEDFSSSIWRNAIVFGLVGAALYKYAPSSEDPILTRFISHYSTPKTVWEDLNVKHLLQTVENQIDTLVIADARRPPVHRYRYPQYV